MTTQKIENYFKKYINDIKNKKEITEKEILEQIKEDYELYDKEEGAEVWGREKDRIKKLVDKIIQIRRSDIPSHIKISTEYLHRSMISAMFPKGRLLFTRHWNLLNEENAQKEITKYQMLKKLMDDSDEITS